MRLKKFSAILSLLLLTSGCSWLTPKPEEKVVVQTKYVKHEIPLQMAPKPLSLNNVTWYVVTEENFPKFIETYKKENGDAWVFYALSVRSYEGMSLNMAEIRRYLQQQKAVIVYYETALTKDKGVANDTGTTEQPARK